MANTTCLAFPQVNGKNSKLYKDLLKTIKDRPKVNWIYSCYIASNIADAMSQVVDANGNPVYKTDNLGEYKADDVLKFIDYASMESEMNDITAAELTLGSVDSNGNRVDFSDAKTALEKADNFNDSHKGLVATVVQHGSNVFNIIVSEKTSRTHMQPTYVKERLKIWDVYKQAFNSIGIDIENLHPDISDIFNANNVDIAQNMRNLQNSQFGWLHYSGALALLSVSPNTPQVQRFINAAGSLENAAKMVDDINHSVGTQTAQQVRLAMNAIAEAQRVQGLDLPALQAQVSQMSTQVRNTSPEESIRATLHQLKKQYGIEINEVQIKGKEIRALSQAAARAAIQLERRIREIKKQQGNDAEGKRLEGILNQLLKELNNKRYYSGLLNFLGEAVALQQEIDNMIVNTPQTGTEIEKAFAQAKTLTDIKQIRDQYYPIVDALAQGNVTIDESINQTDIDNLVNTAKGLKEFFDNKDGILKSLATDTMIHILEQIIGDRAPDGQTIANVVNMAQTDSSLWDYLYSMGRASNPILGAMGSIVLNAKESRDAKINNLSERIRKATYKLHKSGSGSEFMYEPDNIHIISDIDWGAYEAAKKAQMKVLGKQGLSGFDFRMALQNWEEANTEDRVVDTTNGRTERVPDKRYRKAFPQLTPAQLEYYNTMMQIKGEIGSYLPAFAQRQYFAPQLRRNTLDAFTQGDFRKGIKNKLQDFWIVREDDTNYGMNGVIDGEDYQYVEGNYDDTPYRQIPIFYINKVEDGELLKDFSTGLQHLAGTAINYDAISDIAQVVEFMGDFTKDRISAKDSGNKQDIVDNKFIKVFQQLKKWGRNTNTDAIIDGFISSLLYGVKRDPSENKHWNKVVDNLVGYTSFKGLATNVKGAFSNYLVGEFQMLIEAGCGEFYGFKDYGWAHTKLFGTAGVTGEIWDLLTDNINSKSNLLGQLFDPVQENFQDKMGKRYHKNLFRRLLGHDCSFIGYASGEYLIHYVNMYAILHNQKVLLNGKTISLYDAFKVSNKRDGNSQLVLKQGVTKLDGTAITDEWIQDVRNKIRYANQTTHGAMNEEDKGVIHRKWYGRMAMNFRQWMIEHYSRRFRKRHFDYTLKSNREGYWYSVYKGFEGGEGAEAWKDDHYAKALGYFARDLMMFAIRAQSQWSHLDEMQKHNIKRAHSEFVMWLALCGLSFALGEPEDHKKEFWRRWWIYQTRRLILDTEASMPHPQMPKNALTILQSPMAGVTVLNSLLYCLYGIGDITEEIKSGPHKGENRYWRTVKKNAFPFFKDIEQMQEFDTSDAVFMPFTSNNPNR